MPKLIPHALQVNIRGGRLPDPEANGRRYLKIPLGLFGDVPWSKGDADGAWLAAAGGCAGRIGLRLTEAEEMPDIGANSLSIAFGVFRPRSPGDRGGVRMLRDRIRPALRAVLRDQAGRRRRAGFRRHPGAEVLGK